MASFLNLNIYITYNMYERTCAVLGDRGWLSNKFSRLALNLHRKSLVQAGKLACSLKQSRYKHDEGS